MYDSGVFGMENRSSKTENTTQSQKQQFTFSYHKSEAFNAAEIGKRLAEFRKGIGLSQSEFAKLINCSYTGLRKFEAGECFPGAGVLIMLHEKLGVDLQWLLFGRHSTHGDVCYALMHLKKDELFDIFLRLMSYYQSGKISALNPANGNVEEAGRFAEWDGTLYRCFDDAQTTSNEDVFCNWSITADEIKNSLPSLNEKQQENVLAYIKFLQQNPV